MPELVINVSSIISPLCYTLLRLEPYTSCPFKCVYCYSKWYMRSPTHYVYPRPKALGMFRDFVERVYRRGLKPIPFRLSTLVDPFPPHEQLYRISEKILKMALKYSYPLIINTKSSYFLHQPLKTYIERLLDQRLAVLQISVSSLDNSFTQRIEPGAPDPLTRFRAVKELGLSDHPIALRISPYIPCVSPTTSEDVEGLINIARDVGIRHVIAETLRMESSSIGNFLKALDIPPVNVEGYSLREVDGLKPLSRVSLRFMESIYSMLVQRLEKYGIGFATCKEGLFDLHTTPDCCGVYLLRDCIVRPTLYDVYRYVVEVGTRDIGELLGIEVLKNICRRYSRLCSDELDRYPKMVSKALRSHEKRLLKILHNTDLLGYIAPHLAKRLTVAKL